LSQLTRVSPSQAGAQKKQRSWQDLAGLAHRPDGLAF
jgi:hypothetical protein